MLFWSFFSVMPMFVCLLGVVLLLVDKESNLSKRYLIFFLLLSLINYFVHAAFFNREYRLFAFADNIWIFTSLAGYPLYYYYIRLLTKDLKINWRWYWLVLPAFLLSCFSFFLYFSMSPVEVENFIRNEMYHERECLYVESIWTKLQFLKLFLFKVIFIVQIVLSVYFGYKLIEDYNKAVKEFYSNTCGKELTSIKWVLSAFVFASIISLLSGIIGKDFFVDKGVLLVIPSVMHSLFLFLIVYVGYHQNFTVREFMRDVDVVNNNIEISEGNMNLEEVKKKDVFKLLSQEEMFKNPDLRITDIAYLLGSNRTYISRIINEEMNTNFCDYVNNYRIDYAKKIMTDSKYNHLILSEIAEMSGFASISVFYRVFKQKNGISPGEYRKRKNSSDSCFE